MWTSRPSPWWYRSNSTELSSRIFTIGSYLSYRLRAAGAHALHSPFVFALYNKVLRPQKHPRRFGHLHKLYDELRRSDKMIEVVDFKTGRVRRKTVGAVARASLSGPSFSEMLVRLCDYLQVRSVLETGTSLGFNALYLAQSETVEKVVSIEGSDSLHHEALDICKQEPKVHLIQGDIYAELEPALVRHQPELVFLDADHRSSAIRFCLEKIRAHCPHVRCVVVHDIYWSRDMRSGWHEVMADPSYNLTIDIFRAGLIFPTYPIEKQHFTLKA